MRFFGAGVSLFQNSVPFGGCISWGCWVPITPLGLWWVDRLPRVGDLCDEPVDVVGRVAGCLDSTVGQRDRERASDNTLGVLGLRLLEVGLAVVVGDAVLVGERLGSELLDNMGGGGVALRGDTRHKSERGDKLQ